MDFQGLNNLTKQQLIEMVLTLSKPTIPKEPAFVQIIKNIEESENRFNNSLKEIRELLNGDNSQEEVQEQKEYVIAIPSLNRSESIINKTLETLKRQNVPKEYINIFVIKEEYDLYVNTIPKDLYNKIIIGKLGLLEQKKFISSYYPENTNILSLDDDIEQVFKRKYSKKENVSRNALSETEEIDLHEFIIESFKILRQEKLNIFGISYVKNCFMMTDGYTKDLRMIEACFYGFINTHNKKYDLPITSKYKGIDDDIERTIIYYKNDGGVLRFNEVACIHDYKADGGIKTSLNGISRNDIILKVLKEFENEYSNYGYVIDNKLDGKTFKLYKKFTEIKNVVIPEVKEEQKEEEVKKEKKNNKKIIECVKDIHYKIKPEDRLTKEKLSNKLSYVVRILNGFEDEFKTLMNINPNQKFDKSDEVENTESNSMLMGFDWSNEYPEYKKVSNDRYKNAYIKFYFYTEELRDDFIKTLKSNGVHKKTITEKTKSIWYPDEPVNKERKDGYYKTDEKVQPQYPIYIPSYKRYDTLYTALSLEELSIKDYYIVIRPSDGEPEKYKEALKKHNISLDKLLIMPQDYMDKQKALGNDYSIVPRNYGWEHAIKNGFTHHWSLDDNIKGFFYRNKGKILPFKNTGYSFYFIEEYIKKYPNTYQAGMYPTYLSSAEGDRSIIIKNSRIYSCMLNKHYKDFRYQGIHNEDTDLSLRFLKDGKATLDFQIFLCGKQATLTVAGGNRDSAYLGKGFDDKADEIVRKYPDIAKKVMKYGRPHHQINYNGFLNNDLTLKDYKIKTHKINFIEKVIV